MLAADREVSKPASMVPSEVFLIKKTWYQVETALVPLNKPPEKVPATHAPFNLFVNTLGNVMVTLLSLSMQLPGEMSMLLNGSMMIDGDNVNPSMVPRELLVPPDAEKPETPEVPEVPDVPDIPEGPE